MVRPDIVNVPDSGSLSAIKHTVSVEMWVLPQTISSGGTAYIYSRRDPICSENFSVYTCRVRRHGHWPTATFVVWKLVDPSHRNGFILCQVLGIVDLIMVVSLGTTARLLDPQRRFDGGHDRCFR